MNKKSSAPEAISVSISVRIPYKLDQKLRELAELQGSTKTAVIIDILQQRAFSARKDIGLELQRLKCLHLLEHLLESDVCRDLDRQSAAQRLFDEVYEKFYSAIEREGGADGR